MPRWTVPALAISSVLAGCGSQTTDDPFPDPIETEDGLVVVDVVDFASVPDSDGQPARMMLLVDEPNTGRIFVNDMRGALHQVGYDGETMGLYVDIDDPEWKIGRVDATPPERGFQSFAFHPEFGQGGEPGYGRFYTWSDVQDTAPEADFRPGGGESTHHTVLHEWAARDASASMYDGGPPRELMRFEQPFVNHNGGLVAFNPLASPGDEDYGLLYVGVADGGSGGDPLNLAQDLSQGFGKILRIDPLGSNAAGGRYGIPASNPFVGESGALGEIYAYGMRSPQRFGWDPATGDLITAEIGQNIVEWVSLVPKGGNLGWNEWEGSYRFIDRSAVSLESPRSDASITYPLVEYGRSDPLMQRRVAVTGIHVYRAGRIEALHDRVVFGDLVAGEILHFDADEYPEGGTEGIRRILLRDGDGEVRTFLELIQEKNIEQGREPASRADLRFGAGPDNRLFLLNKHDGTIREVVPSR